ncbi:hypothetical protein RND81_07G185800 [Saponaria officinalis]|uniref:GATA transcription factor n=1 Tax=Saponaria officinalis TaxID=3572 RepID=A0AAW1JV22_SAPOF
MRNMLEINNIIEEIDGGSFFDQIDDFLDFPNDDIDSGVFGSRDVLDSAAFQNAWSENSPDFSVGQSQSASHLSAELSVPYEDIVQLEWLSTFVEDSFSGGGLTIEKDSLRNQCQASSPISVLDCSNTSASSRPELLPVSHEKRARSKRPRPAAFTPRPPFELIPPTSSPSFPITQPLKKKQKIKLVPFSDRSDGTSHNQNENPNTGAPVRKCRHCEITKTPQWRAGPMGPKTLCNACGVRYKSGRLYPEYRPAASPTFVPYLHSNSHKKVLEMRGCYTNTKPDA